MKEKYVTRKEFNHVVVLIIIILIIILTGLLLLGLRVGVINGILST